MARRYGSTPTCCGPTCSPGSTAAVRAVLPGDQPGIRGAGRTYRGGDPGWITPASPTVAPGGAPPSEVSVTVSSTGRQVSPPAYAAGTSPVCSPASSPSAGTQTGSSVHGSMPGPADDLRRHPHQPGRRAGCRLRRFQQAAHCSGRSGGPGASTSPPRSIRRSHHGIRPTISQGPRIRPARASRARRPKAPAAAISPPGLAAGWSSPSPDAGSASTAGALSSAPGGIGHR